MAVFKVLFLHFHRTAHSISAILFLSPLSKGNREQHDSRDSTHYHHRASNRMAHMESSKEYSSKEYPVIMTVYYSNQAGYYLDSIPDFETEHDFALYVVDYFSKHGGLTSIKRSLVMMQCSHWIMSPEHEQARISNANARHALAPNSNYSLYPTLQFAWTFPNWGGFLKLMTYTYEFALKSCAKAAV